MLPCSGWPACVRKTPARTQQNRHTGHSGNIRHSSWPPSKCPSELALTQGVIPSRIHCLVGKPAVGAPPTSLLVRYSGWVAPAATATGRAARGRQLESADAIQGDLGRCPQTGAELREGQC